MFPHSKKIKPSKIFNMFFFTKITLVENRQNIGQNINNIPMCLPKQKKILPLRGTSENITSERM